MRKIEKKREKFNTRIVKKTIRESKEIVLELSNSVDSFSSEGSSLKGVKSFLEQLEQEMTEELPTEIRKEVRKNLAEIVASFLLTMLLPVIQLLLGFGGKAVKWLVRSFGE